MLAKHSYLFANLRPFVEKLASWCNLSNLAHYLGYSTQQIQADSLLQIYSKYVKKSHAIFK